MQENKIYMIQTDMCFVLLQVPEDLKRQADKRIKALTTGKVQSVVMCAHMYCFSQHALWSCPFPLPFSSRIHLITHLSHTSPLTPHTLHPSHLTHTTPHTLQPSHTSHRTQLICGLKSHSASECLAQSMSHR